MSNVTIVALLPSAKHVSWNCSHTFTCSLWRCAVTPSCSLQIIFLHILYFILFCLNICLGCLFEPNSKNKLLYYMLLPHISNHFYTIIILSVFLSRFKSRICFTSFIHKKNKYQEQFTLPTPISVLFISILLPTGKQTWSFSMYYNFPYGLHWIQMLKQILML